MLGACSGVGFGIGIAAYLLGVRVSSSAVIGPTVAALATLIPFLYAAVVEDLPPVLAWLGAITIVTGLLFVTMGGDASNVQGRPPDRDRVRPRLRHRHGVPRGCDRRCRRLAGRQPALYGLHHDHPCGRCSESGRSCHRCGSRRSRPPPDFGGLSTALLLAGFTFNAAATSVTASLFPATSVAAGRLFFGDAVSRAQVIGLVIVIIGTITIVIA